jgi:hypothetical protein
MLQVFLEWLFDAALFHLGANNQQQKRQHKTDKLAEGNEVFLIKQ